VSATVLIGHDVRHWTRFKVQDATPAEVEALTADDEQSMVLMRAMRDAGRLTLESSETDDNPDELSEYSNPSVIKIEQED
jgi:hypothetical protein